MTAIFVKIQNSSNDIRQHWMTCARHLLFKLSPPDTHMRVPQHLHAHTHTPTQTHPHARARAHTHPHCLSGFWL